VDKIISRLNDMACEGEILTIVDMGCGDAKIAQSVSASHFKVHSFDLVAANEHVQVANMTKVPLADASVDIVIFCLSLMNKDFELALREAHRILRPEGRLWIAEVVSRLSGASGKEMFTQLLQRIGFIIDEMDESNTVFVLFAARKPGGNAQIGTGTDKRKRKPLNDYSGRPILKPCVYKKR
jgi:ribosomal RNA-processing protein 8